MNEKTKRYLLFADDYFSVADRVLKLQDAKNFHKSKQHFLELMGRLQINISASKPLVEAIDFDPKYKLPLSLILRSICSDILTILYLITFVDESSEDQVTLENELLLLDRDYQYLCFEILDEEKAFKEKFMGELLPKQDLTKYNEEIRRRLDQYSHLVYETDTKKMQKVSSKTIRKTSKDEIIGEDDKNREVHTISEKHKYSRIKNYPLDEISKLRHIFFLYKYYSQFYHSCPANHQLINQGADIDYYYLKFIQYYIIFSSAWVIKVLFGAEHPLFSQMKELIKYVKEE